MEATEKRVGCLGVHLKLFFVKSAFDMKKNIKLMFFLVFSDGFNMLMSKKKKTMKFFLFRCIFKRETILKNTLHHNLKHNISKTFKNFSAFLMVVILPSQRQDELYCCRLLLTMPFLRYIYDIHTS